MAEFLVRLGAPAGRRAEDAVVRAHVDWLRGLHEAEVLRFCGPCDDGGAIIVLSCPTREDAERIAGEDPFASARVYTTRSVVGISLATPENDFLLRAGPASVAVD